MSHSDIENSGKITMSHSHIENSSKDVKPTPSRIANPGTLGLFSFASTTFMLSLYNLQTRSITTPNVVVGMAIFCGGLAQLLAGMWEFPKGNVFGATAFTSYGAFWMSYATILIPSSGVIAAYTTNGVVNVPELESALGIYLITWFMVTFLLLIGAFKKHVALVALFALLSTTFLLLACHSFTAKEGLAKAGGAVGVVTAFVAYYIGLSDLLAADGVNLPVGKF